jgi:hypothetical protein
VVLGAETPVDAWENGLVLEVNCAEDTAAYAWFPSKPRFTDREARGLYAFSTFSTKKHGRKSLHVSIAGVQTLLTHAPNLHEGIRMTGMRRKDKEITDINETKSILKKAKYVTLAMCSNDEPYLATLSHGYDEQRNCIYFHCAAEGKKISILQVNNCVWGQALIDGGYVQGSCDQLYATAQFSGRVTFVEGVAEKEHALKVMINSLDDNPEEIIKKQLLPQSIQKVKIGRIDIDCISGKKAEKTIISQ